MIETADILARPAVQSALGALVAQTMRDGGISVSHAHRAAARLKDRLFQGEPVQVAVDVVDEIRKTTADGSIIADILIAAANLDTVAANSDGTPLEDMAAERIRARASRLRTFAESCVRLAENKTKRPAP